MVEKSTCRQIRPLLQRFADEELLTEQSTFVRHHLMDCRDCRGTVGGVYSVRKFLEQDRLEIPVPEGFASQVAALAFSGPPIDRTKEDLLAFVRAGTAIAASFLLLMGIFLFLGGRWAENAGMRVHASSLEEIDKEIDDLHRVEKNKKTQPPKNNSPQPRHSSSKNR